MFSTIVMAFSGMPGLKMYSACGRDGTAAVSRCDIFVTMTPVVAATQRGASYLAWSRRRDWTMTRPDKILCSGNETEGDQTAGSLLMGIATTPVRPRPNGKKSNGDSSTGRNRFCAHVRELG